MTKTVHDRLEGEVMDRLPRKFLLTERTRVIWLWVDPNPFHRLQVQPRVLQRLLEGTDELLGRQPVPAPTPQGFFADGFQMARQTSKTVDVAAFRPVRYDQIASWQRAAVSHKWCTRKSSTNLARERLLDRLLRAGQGGLKPTQMTIPPKYQRSHKRSSIPDDLEDMLSDTGKCSR